MLLLLIIILVLLLAGGGGFYGRRAGWGPRRYGVGLIVLVLVVILLVWLFNELLLPPLPMPAGVPSITR